VISVLLTALTLAACGDDAGTSNSTTTGPSTGVSATDTDPGQTSENPTGMIGTTGEPSETTTTGPSETTTTGPLENTTTGEPETTAVDPTTTGEPMENTMIRVVHLSPGAPAVDIFANNDGSTPVVDALALRNSITLTVPAGEYEFAIAADGSPIDQAVFKVPKLAYDAGKMYTVVAVGKLANKTFDILRLNDDADGLDPTQVRLQVTHAAAAAPFAEVDVWAGADADSLMTLIPDFKFKSSATTDVPPNDLTIGLDINNDSKPDAVWNVAGAALGQGVGMVANVFAYSDEQDKPSLQVVLFDGEAIELKPE